MEKRVRAVVLVVGLLAWALWGTTLVRWYDSSRSLQSLRAQLVAMELRPERPAEVGAVIIFSNRGSIATDLQRVSARLHHPDGLMASVSHWVDQGWMEPGRSLEVTLPFVSRLASEHLPDYDASTSWRVEMVITVRQPVYRGTHRLDFSVAWPQEGDGP